MSTRRPHEFVTFPAALAGLAPYGPYRAVVRHVVDGDTLDVLLDLGFNSYTYETLRIRGIDAPERHTPQGREAQAYVREMLPPGAPVVVQTHKDRQTFGRYVADVSYVGWGGQLVDLATDLVVRGFAVEVVR